MQFKTLTKPNKYTLLLVFLAFLLAFSTSFFASSANAQPSSLVQCDRIFAPDNVIAGPSGGSSGIDFAPGIYAGPAPGLFRNVVTCARAMIFQGIFGAYNPISGTYEAGIGVFDTMRDDFANIIASLLTIYVIFFGYRFSLAGYKNFKSEILITVLTLVFIIYMVLDVGLEDYVQLAINTQEALLNTVGSALDVGGGLVRDYCGYDDIWIRMDCTFALVMGVDVSNYVNVTYDGATGQLTGYDHRQQGGLWGGLGIGPYLVELGSNNPIQQEAFLHFAVLIGLLFTDFGPFIFLIGGFIPILLVAAFAQTVVIYLTSMLVIIFMGLIGPIIIPMLLFEKTKSMFDYWLQIIFAYTLQPAILMGYIVFVMHAMSIAIFSDVGLGANKLSENFDTFKRYANNPDDRDKHFTKFDFMDMQASTSAVASETTGTSGKTAAGGAVEGSFHTAWFIFEPGNEDLNKEKEGDFLQSLLVVFIMCALCFSFMQNVIEFGAQLSGVIASPLANSINFYNMAAKNLKAKG